MSNAEPFTVEELDAMRQELAASDSIYLRAEQSDARWIATIAALSARAAKLEAEQSEARNRVARLEAALTYYADLDAHGARLDVYESNYTGDPADIELDRGAKARAALEDPK